MPRRGMRRTRRHFVKVRTMAFELGVSVRRVQQLTRAGVLKRAARDRYWLEGNKTFYEVYLREFKQRKGYLPWTGRHDKRTGRFRRTR